MFRFPKCPPYCLEIPLDIFRLHLYDKVLESRSVSCYMTVRSAHVQLSKMADKQAKVTKRKKKRKPKDSHEFSLEDVLAVGGDKAGSILKSFFASGSIFLFINTHLQRFHMKQFFVTYN